MLRKKRMSTWTVDQLAVKLHLLFDYRKKREKMPERWCKKDVKPMKAVHMRICAQKYSIFDAS